MKKRLITIALLVICFVFIINLVMVFLYKSFGYEKQRIDEKVLKNIKTIQVVIEPNDIVKEASLPIYEITKRFFKRINLKVVGNDVKTFDAQLKINIMGGTDEYQGNTRWVEIIRKISFMTIRKVSFMTIQMTLYEKTSQKKDIRWGRTFKIHLL